MTLSAILIFIVFGLVFGWLPWFRRGRNWALLASSALAVFWLQPALPVRGLDFWLPVVTLALAGLSWYITATPEARALPENRAAAGLLAAIILLVGLTRLLPQPLLTASRPPPLASLLLGLALAAAVAALLALVTRRGAGRWLPGGLVVLLVLIFVVIKSPGLATWTSAGLRALVGQSVSLAASADLRWLGFSYLAFRLIHTARDRQTGRLPAVSLREYVTYAVFYPALTAGPIDRLERFVKDLRKPYQPCAPDLETAGRRLAVGLFRKFVVADALALVALNAANAGQVRAAGWTWLLVYAYAFQIYFDFSGYTDIAVGLAMLLGIRLPENFNAPYLKPNLTQFWNNWHMTLTHWFRAYYFNPLSRWLRTSKPTMPMPVLVLVTQISTMVLIGLWHGITWNFILWGAWHGLGLFAQNRFSDFARARLPVLEGWKQRLVTGVNTLLTFHYIALGWIWFALPSPSLSLGVFAKLLGW